MSDAFRKCDGCGSIVPVRETDPPSGFVRWEPVDARALSARLSALEQVAEAARALIVVGGIVPIPLSSATAMRWRNLEDALAGLGADTQESGV